MIDIGFYCSTVLALQWQLLLMFISLYVSLVVCVFIFVCFVCSLCPSQQL